MGTPLQDITTFQTDATIFDNFLSADANTQVDFSQAQDGSDMRPSLAMLLANMGLRPAANGACAAATTGALPACTYNNGASGVGATLTANANGAFPSGNMDGVVAALNQRLLVHGSGIWAGAYVFTAIGDGTHPWILTRDTDSDSAEELGYELVFVTGGATFAGSAWLQPLSGADIVVGTTPIPFMQLPLGTTVSAEQARAEAAELAIENGLRSCENAQAANFTLDGTADFWPVNANAGAIVASVPAGAGFANQEWTVKKTDNSGNTVTLQLQVGEALDGANTFVLHNQNAAVTFRNKRGSTTWFVKSLYLT
jgi:hypothetical protein